MKNNFKDWRMTSFSHPGRASVPARSGVYAIVRTRRVFGLPTSFDVLYVGRSKSLRTRLAQHLNLNAAHNEVSFSSDRSTLEFWCHLMPDDEIVSAEAELIRSIKPSTNKILYN
jgi:excinuclease UvrABC nuclease subunit